MTDPVRVVGWKVRRHERPVSELHWQSIPSADRNDPLILATDEAGWLEGLADRFLIRATGCNEVAIRITYEDIAGALRTHAKELRELK
ncbi:hypothetical protein LCGC14_1842360 [marine sediment metagenome]|uniref:Uncharacterized protein n=1 Tax=marine sediment metagenome TaxID=412755 RepID=A0A0F9JC46_9ZZZZ